MSDTSLPAGTVTLMFTDIESSTQLLERLGDAYAEVLAEHHRIVDAAASANGGARVDAAGDGLFYSFQTARGGLAAAVAAQVDLADHTWPDDSEIRVRIGLHCGEPRSSGTGYVGIDVHRASRICSAGHGGQILVSDAVRILIGTSGPPGVTLQDLGTHQLKGLDAPERIFQVTAPDLRADFPPIRSLDTTPNNLPRQLSSFVGRTAEIAEAEERLREAAVLTLTGPGGVGKTRLAVEIGARQAGAYPGGVWLVDLGSVAEGPMVADAIASALGVKQRAGAGLVTGIVESLGDRPVLLMLDNCEHLLDAVVATGRELLRRVPGLQILATSREALGIAGEVLMPVPSMSVPEAAGDRPNPFVLAESEAVQLFVGRAMAVLPEFRLDEANAAAVAQICRRLDGIPLAIELAAARVRSLPVLQIAARLDHRFRLLSGGSRTALPRHRTLRATFDWSFDLLSLAEQTLLARLCVFGGSFSLEAAETVCRGGAVPTDDVLNLLGRLIDRSLLQTDADGGQARYRMLETIREYAEEHLAGSDDAMAVRARHRDWCLALVEEARPAFFSGAVQPQWVARLRLEHDNLLAALRWADEDPEGADAEMELASGLWRFWEVSGNLTEGSAWLGRALERIGGEVSVRRATALTGAGVLAARRGDLAQAASYHDASLMLNRELGDPLAIAAAGSNSASVAVERGDLDRARQLYTEGIELTRSKGAIQGAAYTMINLADVAARQGDTDEAERIFAESIDAFRMLGDRFGVAHATTKLAQAARRRGDRVAARARMGEALAIHEEIGDRHGAARLSATLGDLAAEDGDEREAERLYRMSLAIRGELVDRAGAAGVLERMAGVCDDRPLRAAMLLGAAEALRDQAGTPLSAASQRTVDEFLDKLGRRAGPDEVAAATRAGRVASWEAILERGARAD